jgi:hypothetical protein
MRFGWPTLSARQARITMLCDGKYQQKGNPKDKDDKAENSE